MRRAFSLLELTAVVALMGALLGISLLNMQAASDESCLQAAADEIATVYRLALMEATRTGRPHALALRGTTCSIRRPIFAEGHWTWHSGANFDLPRRVRIEQVNRGSSSEVASLIPVVPHDWNVRFHVQLGVPSGLRKAFEIGGLAGTVCPLKDSD